MPKLTYRVIIINLIVHRQLEQAEAVILFEGMMGNNLFACLFNSSIFNLKYCLCEKFPDF